MVKIKIMNLCSLQSTIFDDDFHKISNAISFSMVVFFNTLFNRTFQILISALFLWENADRDFGYHSLKDREMTQRRMHINIFASRQRIEKQVVSCLSVTVSPSTGEFFINAAINFVLIFMCRA